MKKKIDSIYILPNKLSSKIRTPKNIFRPKLFKWVLKSTIKIIEMKKRKNLYLEKTKLFFLFLPLTIFFFIWFIYACWVILYEATAYWEPTIWINENLESMKPSTPMPRDPLIAFFVVNIRKCPDEIHCQLRNIMWFKTLFFILLCMLKSILNKIRRN